jgi:hypothetical protein
MKNEPLFKLLGVAMFASVILAFASAASAAARDGGGSDDATVSRSDGVVTRSGTRQTRQGPVAWQTRRSWDPATRTATISGSKTLPDGRRTTWQATRVRTAKGAFDEKGVAVSADGRQSAFAATLTRVAPGVWEIRRTVTSADGKVTRQTITVTRSGGTVTRVALIVRPDGTTETRTTTRAARRAQGPGAVPDP